MLAQVLKESNYAPEEGEKKVDENLKVGGQVDAATALCVTS